MLRQEMFQNNISCDVSTSDECGISIESFQEDMSSYTQEGLLDKIFPSIKRNREIRQEQQKKVVEQQDKDRAVFKSFVSGFEQVRGSRDLIAETYDESSLDPHGIFLWDKKDNLMFSIISLKSFGGKEIEDIKVSPKDKMKGVSVLDPWVDFPFGAVEVATTTDLDFDDYQVGDYFTDGFYTTNNVNNGGYLILVTALDEPSLDRTHSTCSAIGYVASTFGEKTFKSAVDAVIKDRSAKLKDRKYLSMVVT